MSSKNINKSELEGIFNRIKEALNAQTYAQLATEFGRGVATIHGWFNRESIPYEAIDFVVLNKKISHLWLISGEGPKVSMEYWSNELLSAFIRIQEKKRVPFKEFRKIAPELREVYPDHPILQNIDAATAPIISASTQLPPSTVKQVADLESAINEIDIQNDERLQEILSEKAFDPTDPQSIRTAQAQIERLTPPKPTADEQDDMIFIPEYSIELAAGTGFYPDNHALVVGNRAFSKEWIKKKGLQQDKLVMARVHGDSMEPMIKDKDIIMIDQSRTKPNENMPFAINYDGELYVKLIQPAESGKLKLVSVNKYYESITIDLEQSGETSHIIGAIVWHAHSYI